MRRQEKGVLGQGYRGVLGGGGQEGQKGCVWGKGEKRREKGARTTDHGTLR